MMFRTRYGGTYREGFPMKRWMLSATLALTAALPLTAQEAELARALQAPAAGTKTHECVLRTITCGQTLSDEITTGGCATTSGPTTLFDAWSFEGVPGQVVTFDMASNELDPFLLAIDPDGNSAGNDDDSGPGFDARLVIQVDETGEWTLGASGLLGASETGSYTLSMSCSGGEPEPEPEDPPAGPWLTTPELPGFRFKARIASTRIATQVDDCVPETLCLAGAVSDRTEIFVRIIGPRPNGFLWPQVVRFTVARVEVWVQEGTSGPIKYYLLPGVSQDSDTLNGLVDRQGFLP
jgi:hypothetical protein